MRIEAECEEAMGFAVQHSAAQLRGGSSGSVGRLEARRLGWWAAGAGAVGGRGALAWPWY